MDKKMNVDPSSKSYGALKNDLENLLTKLEAEDIDIDEAAELYAQAKKIITQMEASLKDKQAVIKKINSKKTLK